MKECSDILFGLCVILYYDYSCTHFLSRFTKGIREVLGAVRQGNDSESRR